MAKIDCEKLLAEYGLKVGDKIRFNNRPHIANDSKFEIVGGKRFYLKCGVLELEAIDSLVEFEWEKVEQKKTVGDMYCCDVDCEKCKLFCLNCLKCNPSKILTIREIFQDTLKHYPELEPMRKYLEKELDKEIEDNDIRMGYF